MFPNIVENYEKDDFYGEEIVYEDDPNAGATEKNDKSLEVVEDNLVLFGILAHKSQWHSGNLSFHKYFNQ